MPYSSGVFSVVYNWTTESGAPPIEIAKLDTQHADFATGLSNCILRDGTGLPTSAIPWNSQNLTGVAQLEAARFVPTGSTVPSNGMYLPAANTVAWATNTTLRGSVNATGNWTFAAPSSGASIASQGPITVTISGITQTIGNDGTGPFLDIGGANSWRLFTNSTQRMSVGAAGNVTINSPSSGLSLAVSGIANGNIFSASDGTRSAAIGTDSSNGTVTFGAISSHGTDIYAGNAQRIRVAAAGNVTINAPSSGAGLTATAPAGGTSAQFTDGTRTARVDHSASNIDFGTFTADALNLVSNSSRRVVIGTAGNVTINSPSSGATLALNQISGQNAINATDGTISQSWGNNSSVGYIGTNSAHAFNLVTNASLRLAVGSAGNVTINAPSSGAALTVTGVSGTNTRFTFGSVNIDVQHDASNGYFGTQSNHALTLFTNNTNRVAIAAAGNVTINAPSSGTALALNGVVGGVVQSWSDGTVAGNITLSGGGFTFGTTNSTPVGIQSNGTTRVVVAAAGNVTISGAVATPPVAVTFSATAMTVNCTLSNVFTTTFTANVTSAPTLSNPQDGQTINWFITQDATGSRTMTWPSTFRWPGGVAGVLSTAANAVDLMVATYRSGPNAWYASLSKGFA